MNLYKKIDIETTFDDIHDITQYVKDAVEESGVKEGTCIVYNPHSTAALALTSFWDPAGFDDLRDEINRLIPTKVNFKHQHDTPQDAAGHVKSAIVGISQIFIIHEGKLVLGSSQGIYFLEFDGPRKRKFMIKVVED